MKIEQLACSLGAELVGVNLADAVHDDGRMLRHKTNAVR